MKAKIKIPCRMCGNKVTVEFENEDFDRWQAGELIQNAMPYLNDAEREMMISQTCDDCWKNLFSDLDNE